MAYKIKYNGEVYSINTLNQNFNVRTDSTVYQLVPVIDLTPYAKISNILAGTGITINYSATGVTINSTGGVDVDNFVSTNLFTGYTGTTDIRITDLENILDTNTGTYFTSQAFATWSGSGLNFDVIYPAYYINGVRYNGGQTQITLNAADTTNDRIDMIAVDSTGVIKLTGTASVNPIEPTIDTTTQIEITTVYIAANATTPTQISDVDVYKENIEWTGSTNIGSLVFNSTTSPFAGSKCISSGTFSNLQYFKFKNSTSLDATNYSVLKYYLELKAAFVSTAYFAIKFYNGNTLVSNTVTVTNGKFNYNQATVNTYQLINIPLSNFTFTNSSFDTIYFEMRGTNATGFRVDNIILQTGSNLVSPLQNTLTTIKTNSGNASVTIPNDTFTITGNSGINITASGKIISVSGFKNIFNSYTGVTAPSTYQSHSSIVTLTGSTLPATYETKSAFNSYTGATLTTLNSKLNSSLFNSYTGTTAPSTYQSHSSIVTLTGTTLPSTYALKSNFNTYTGTTAPATYETKSAFNTYTGATLTTLNSKLNSSLFNTYTGTTAPATFQSHLSIVTLTGTTLPSTYQSHSSIVTLTGTTLPATYASKSIFNSYTGATLTTLNSKLNSSLFNTYTGTTAPATYALKSNFNTFTGTTAPATYLKISNFNSYSASTLTNINSRLLTTTFNSYTGTTAPATYALKSNFNTFTGTTAPSTYQSHTSIVTLTGTTLPATYASKTNFNTYTGTTAPATYALKSNFNSYTGTTNSRLTTIETNYVTGATNLGSGNGLYTSLSNHKAQFKSLVAGSNITLTPSSTGITITSTGGGGSGTITGATNIGSGAGLYKQTVSNSLQVRSIAAGSGISITTGDTITINNTGSGSVTFAQVLSIAYLS